MKIDAPLRLPHLLWTALAFGLLGPLPLASAQGPTPIEMAVEALEIQHPLPSGWTVEVGNTRSDAPAEVRPRSRTIVVDPRRIAATFPRVSEHEANLPGVLFIFLLHEWHHANEYTLDPSDDGP